MEKNKKIEIWCTLGPSSINAKVINRLSEEGVSMLRINLSHTNFTDIEKVFLEIKQYTDKPICFDTEGPQVRSGKIKKNRVFVSENSKVIVPREEVEGDQNKFNLYPLYVLSELEIGDVLSVDFDSVLLSVADIKPEGLVMKVICGGWVGSNKAVTIDRHIDMPILSEKDRQAIEVIKKHSLKQVSLSFVRTKQDVLLVKELLDPDVKIISKIETKLALENLKEIIEVSDAILIDRGDLSREEPINKIPLLQKSIIKEANRQYKPVVVATNFLESMVKSKKPLRSEVNDIMNTLLDGADGLVLAAETAIGDYPIECFNMVKRMIKYFHIANAGYSMGELSNNDSFLLMEPHGGILVQNYNPHADFDLINKLPKLRVDEKVIIDVEQLGIGTYSPLAGFLNKDDLNGVLDNYKLSSGVVWTLPIVLQVSKEKLDSLKVGERIALVYENDSLIYATLKISDIFPVNPDQIAKKWFATEDKEHPGVKRLFENGDYFIGGDIELLRRRHSEHSAYEFTPKQTRLIFEHKEWSRVAGFHTRNAIHRAHEYIQMSAIENYGLDGLLLHPVIGPKKLNDFKANIILESYQIMLDNFYPKDKVVLGAFSAYSHYAGPREAIFTALCRKNFGCSHFIVGRDHTGLRDYYESDGARKLFQQLGDIGIKPIFFDTVHYCKKCKQYVEHCVHDTKDYLHISGTQAREMLISRKQPPYWFLRKKISKLILDKIEKGIEVFVK